MKTTLITGASRGIGKALAEKFLAEGYFVIGTSKKGTADFTHDLAISRPTTGQFWFKGEPFPW